MCNCSQCSQRIYRTRLGHKVGVDLGAQEQEQERCDQDICGSAQGSRVDQIIAWVAKALHHLNSLT